MNRKIAYIIILVLIISMLTVGCNKIRTSKDYSFYTYQATQGQFVENTGKITFDGDDYSMYNNNGQVTNVGKHSTNEGVVSFIPDKIGDNSQIAGTTRFYVYKEFIIDPAFVINRVTDTLFEEKDELEGRYNNNAKLSDGKIYESADSSNIESSFTEQVATYEINKNKDFLVVYNDSGTVDVYLMFTYTDGFGYEVSALATQFYSYKEPKLKNLGVTSVELQNKVFLANSTGTYDLELLFYPEKNTNSNDVTFEVDGVNASASINGSTLTYNGTGTVDIKYSYDNFEDTETVYVVDMQLKAGLTDPQKTFTVGDVVDYDVLVAQVCDYDSYWFAYESVTSSNEEKAECENGEITFKETGTVQVSMTVRYFRTLIDGTRQIVEKSLNINLIIT